MFIKTSQKCVLTNWISVSGFFGEGKLMEKYQHLIRKYFASGELMQEYSVNEYEQKHGLSLHWYKNGQSSAQKAVRSRCWASVQLRNGACKAKRPLLPLVTW